MHRKTWIVIIALAALLSRASIAETVPVRDGGNAEKKNPKLATDLGINLRLNVKDPGPSWGEGLPYGNITDLVVKGHVLHIAYNEKRSTDPSRKLPEFKNWRLDQVLNVFREKGREGIASRFGGDSVERIEKLIKETDWSVERSVIITSEPIESLDEWEDFNLNVFLSTDANRKVFQLVYGEDGLKQADEAIRIKNYSKVWLGQHDIDVFNRVAALEEGPLLSPDQLNRIRHALETIKACEASIFDAYQKCKSPGKDPESTKALFSALQTWNDGSIPLEILFERNDLPLMKGINVLTPDQQRQITRSENKEKGVNIVFGNIGIKGTIEVTKGGAWSATMKFSGVPAQRVLETLIVAADDYLGEVVVCPLDPSLANTPVTADLTFKTIEECLGQIAHLAGGKLSKAKTGFSIGVNGTPSSK